MLTSEQIIQKLENEKKDLARQIAQEIKQRQVEPLAIIPLKQLEQAIMPSIDMVLNYFRTDDSTTVKNEIQERAATQVKQGYPAISLQLGIEIIADNIEQAIEIITGGDDGNAAVRAKYKNRVDNIKALSKVSVVKYNLKENF